MPVKRGLLTLARSKMAGAVERGTQGIDDPTQKHIADGHADDFSRRIGDVALAEFVGIVEEDRPHAIPFEIHDQRVFVAAEIEEFAVFDVGQAGDGEDAVAAGDDAPRVRELVLEPEGAHLVFEFFGYRAVNANRFHG